ncbi:MAG TPA: ATP-binding protein, partial [Candidatus Elarobacter sp.]|nr:ATP-binding protein [Candidatus Elarobacter sp.]
AFSLLCAYSLDGFDDVADAAAFGEICGHHTRVFPTERYAEADDDARLREVSLLQQRARSLETEIARRADLEQRLHRTELDLQAYLAHAGDAVSRARDEFLSVMSHELRTPLNAIGGHAGLLELGVHGPITESQREALARIQKNQRHLLGLINEVLNYTRIETGAVTFQVSDVRIGDLVASVAALVRPQIAAKRLSLTVEPCACVPDVVVRVDAEKVQQILLNLLSNAAKFTHADGVITLACDSIGSCDTCDTCCTGDSAVRVHVRDTGIGITPAKLASVFDPFVQVNAGFARDHDGAGLGLAISRDLARAMGGDLVATSVVDVGSEFTLLLPRVG